MDRSRELSAFIAVVDAGGFSAASRRTGESQPALSKAVGALERRLGVMLLNRSTRSVTLTDQGQRYYDRTKPLVEEMAEADNELTSSTLGVSGLIRVAAPSTIGRLHILPLIPELLSLNPGLQVELVLSDVVRDMAEDRIDLAIRGGPVDELDAVVRRVGSTPLVCAGSRRYFERHGMPKTPADLADHNCLVYRGATEAGNWPFTGPQGRFSLAVRGSLSSNSIETIRAGVLADIGIGLLTKIVLADELRSPEVVTVLDDYVKEARDVSLVWPQRRFVPARVRLATEFFATALLPLI